MFRILQKILDRDQLELIGSSIVFEDGKDSYQLYNEYSIKKTNGRFVMSKFHTFDTVSFSTLRNAVIYTSLDKRNKIADANRVIELDRLQEGANSCIELHQMLAKKAKNLDQHTIYLTKLNEDTLKKTVIDEELNSFAIKSKQWQEQKFAQVRK